jgi:PIN domain nuclease of toxin-antitoxin system
MAVEPKLISEKARGAIDRGKDGILIDSPADLLERLEQADVELLPITARHADRVETLPMHHQDPFDRLLIAQADTNKGLALVSGDGAMRRYGVEVIW